MSLVAEQQPGQVYDYDVPPEIVGNLAPASGKTVVVAAIPVHTDYWTILVSGNMYLNDPMQPASTACFRVAWDNMGTNAGLGVPGIPAQQTSMSGGCCGSSGSAAAAAVNTSSSNLSGGFAAWQADAASLTTVSDAPASTTAGIATKGIFYTTKVSASCPTRKTINTVVRVPKTATAQSNPFYRLLTEEAYGQCSNGTGISLPLSEVFNKHAVSFSGAVQQLAQVGKTEYGASDLSLTHVVGDNAVAILHGSNSVVAHNHGYVVAGGKATVSVSSVTGKSKVDREDYRPVDPATVSKDGSHIGIFAPPSGGVAGSVADTPERAMAVVDLKRPVDVSSMAQITASWNILKSEVSEALRRVKPPQIAASASSATSFYLSNANYSNVAVSFRASTALRSALSDTALAL
jgi:hypothetical protein